MKGSPVRIRASALRERACPRLRFSVGNVAMGAPAPGWSSIVSVDGPDTFVQRGLRNQQETSSTRTANSQILQAGTGQR